MEFYFEFIRTVFQAADEQGRLRNRIVAFTSAAPGEGVSLSDTRSASPAN